MNNIKTRFLIGSLLCFFSIILMIWTEWPIKSETREIIFQPGDLQVIVPSHLEFDQKTPGGSLEEPLVFRDARKLTLEWTPIVRIGDHSRISLSFTRNESFLADNFEDGAPDPTILNSFKNLFDVYSVNSEARIELSGFDVNPTGISGQTLPEDQAIVFNWKIFPDKDGLYQGVAWLYLRFFPLSEGNIIEQPISAQSFDIKVVSILGLNSNIWRVISVLGIILGIYVQKDWINGLISNVYRLIVKKRRIN